MKQINLMTTQEWDKLVQETYKKPYDFQQQDGCKDRGIARFTVPDEAEDFENETVPEVVNGDEMGVSFAAWLQRDPQTPLSTDDHPWSIRLWWERNFYPDAQMLVNDLHTKGLLPAGELAIEIDW